MVLPQGYLCSLQKGLCFLLLLSSLAHGEPRRESLTRARWQGGHGTDTHADPRSVQPPHFASVRVRRSINQDDDRLHKPLLVLP